MPASAPSSSISWRLYDDEHKLSHVLTEAARACVTAHAASPSDFLLAYFTQATRGDSVADLSCAPVLSPLPPRPPPSDEDATPTVAAEGGHGLSVRLRLFTNTEGSVTVQRLPFALEPLDGGAAPAVTARCGEEAAAAMMAAVAGRLSQSLRQIGVGSQHAWDLRIAGERVAVALTCRAASATAAASRPDSPGAAATEVLPAALMGEAGTLPCVAPLPPTAQLALSLAACIAAANGANGLLCQRVRAVADSSDDAQLAASLDGAAAASVSMPRLLLPLLGADPAAAPPPAGCVHLHTLYVVPRIAADGADRNADADAAAADGAAALPAALLPRLAAAYRVLAERFNRPPVRDDGAVVLHCFENLTDAVQAASEVLRSVGVVPGTDVLFGIRLAAPTVTVGVLAADTAAASPRSGSSVAAASASDGAAAGRKRGASVGSSGAAKKGSLSSKAQLASPADFTYALFPGDPDVTSSQLAEYVRQQVAELGGLVCYISDTHHPRDAAGLARLARGLRSERCGTHATTTPATANGGGAIVDALSQGSVTALAAACRQRMANGAAVTLCAHPLELEPLSAVVDLAAGLGVRFLSFGGLASVEACAALSRYQQLQEALRGRRCLGELPGLLTQPAARDEEDEDEEEEPLPEIRRKSDKKRKKGK